MANYTVPSRDGSKIPIQTQDRDRLSALDVVWADEYEGESISPEHAMEIELEFYRGAPPRWLNFYWAEHQKCPLIKRDMYQELERKITEAKSNSWRVDHVKLFHEPGSGGSTLAMQVLWDLREKLRCAKLLDFTIEMRTIAQQVLQLFRAGGAKNQNTVLLLLDNSEDDFRENLEKILCDEIKANNLTDTIPVVIILSCLCQRDLKKDLNKDLKGKTLKLSLALSDEEKEKFKRKETDIIQKHGDRHTQLYAFNIMLNNYDPGYVTEICKVLNPLKEKKRPRKQQLLAYLALINSYVPGSVLPYDLCLKFIKGEGNDWDDISLKEHMQPFTGFLAIFSAKEKDEFNSEDKHVRMLHPMIAHECLRLITEAGVTRSDTTLNLLKELCKDTMPQSLFRTIKALLTKRENSGKDRFSKLILDINEKEKSAMCKAVLKTASRKFSKDPFFPQALARFFYIELEDYETAEHWAKKAIDREEENSFIRDTLAQVHKAILKNVSKKRLPRETNEQYARKILQHGKKAAESFKAEQEVALKEQEQEHGLTRTSTSFNYRGMFGYMQVANIIFDQIKDLHNKWPKVLTKETPLRPFLSSYDSGNCKKYESFITCLIDDVKKNYRFFEWFLLYSKPSIHKDEPDYVRQDVDDCSLKFVTQDLKNKPAIQIFKGKKASTFAGLQSTNTDLELITEKWKEIYLDSPNDDQSIQNYICANVMLSQMNYSSPALRPLEELQAMLHNLWTEQKDKRSPEFYLLVLLLFWPDVQQSRHNIVDIAECVRYMGCSFKTKYKHFLRSRYLVPLFFLQTGHGLQRFVRRSDLNEETICRLDEGYEIPELLRLSGEVQNYKLYFVQGPVRIEVSPAHPGRIRGRENVSFHLGFNIEGPVAYPIRDKKLKMNTKC